MAQMVSIRLKLPKELAPFRLPRGVNARLRELLDRQDPGERLSAADRSEAEGLVSLAELLSFLRLRAERVSSRRSKIRKKTIDSLTPPF